MILSIITVLLISRSYFQDYVQALMWCMHLYRSGECPNTNFFYEYFVSPSRDDVSYFLRAATLIRPLTLVPPVYHSDSTAGVSLLLNEMYLFPLYIQGICLQIRTFRLHLDLIQQNLHCLCDSHPLVLLGLLGDIFSQNSASNGNVYITAISRAQGRGTFSFIFILIYLMH